MVFNDDLLRRLRELGRAGNEAADELDRLCAERREWLGQRVGYEEALHGAAGANDELRQEVARLRAGADGLKGRVRTLEKMLAPFAAYALALGEPWTGAERLHVLHWEPAAAGRVSPTVGDCRAALGALAAARAAEAGPPRVLTDDQLRFVVLVLEGATGDVGWEDAAVEDAREDVRRRYRAAKQTGPTLSYGECSLWARAAWLRDWLAGLTREGGGGCAGS